MAKKKYLLISLLNVLHFMNEKKININEGVKYASIKDYTIFIKCDILYYTLFCFMVVVLKFI